MQFLLTFFLDFLFPPSTEALRLREMQPAEVFSIFRRAEPLHQTFITSLFSYKDPLIAELVKQIKSQKNRHAYELAGYALYQELLKVTPGQTETKIVLVPIPISKKRRRERGYNQCGLLIEAILKHDTENKFEKRFDILERTKHTEDQKLKNREERLAGSGKIFTAKIVADPNIPLIIIDDVSTTGSTLEQARDTLIKAGYTTISALTLAH